jgi:hypothetical protein
MCIQWEAKFHGDGSSPNVIVPHALSVAGELSADARVMETGLMGKLLPIVKLTGGPFFTGSSVFSRAGL